MEGERTREKWLGRRKGVKKREGRREEREEKGVRGRRKERERIWRTRNKRMCDGIKENDEADDVREGRTKRK